MAKKKEHRSTRKQVFDRVLAAKGLVDSGMRLGEAVKQAGVSENAYRRWQKRGFRFFSATGEGVNIDRGVLRADSIPPRPTGGKGGKRPPKPTDFNSIESLVKRRAKIDKVLSTVQPLKAEHKKITARLRALLRV